MRKVILVAIAGLIASVAASEAGSGKQPPGQRDTNWGEATKNSIAGGFDQGGHSSDPSGDGHGPGTADEPRAGLPNVMPLGSRSSRPPRTGLGALVNATERARHQQFWLRPTRGIAARAV
jgi:hypothetical protein